jgi:hypothetical protein
LGAEKVTEQLLAAVTFRGPIQDPCCGSGRIPPVARGFGYEATGSDIVDRGFGVGDVDFFTDTTLRATLIFNPPSGRNTDPTLSTRFILHALKVAEEVPNACSRRSCCSAPYTPAPIIDDDAADENGPYVTFGLKDSRSRSLALGIAPSYAG